MSTPAPPADLDPSDLVRRLDPEAIRARLDAMHRERQALLILLRASLAAGTRTPRREGVADARR
ncbi:MAG: hypothetical protein C0501_17460 [Isosphaera sp.]|nr:hypothetical protein [Isosphaera sp.]